MGAEMVQRGGGLKFQEGTNTPPLPSTFRAYGYNRTFAVC